MDLPYNPDYIHHQQGTFVDSAREIVFGVEDGMVSTLGALTGIAIGSQNYFMVLLAGFVIIGVESISMGIGAYLSSYSEKQITDRKLDEERAEIEEYPEEEKRELLEMYEVEGWPQELAVKMVEVAAADKNIMLKEMAYRELNIIPNEKRNPVKDGSFMFFAYILGGFIPLTPYFFFPMQAGVYVSVGVTLLGLFGLGALTTKYTKQSWLKAGFHMLILGSVALVVGYAIGTFLNVN